MGKWVKFLLFKGKGWNPDVFSKGGSRVVWNFSDNEDNDNKDNDNKDTNDKDNIKEHDNNRDNNNLL